MQLYLAQGLKFVCKQEAEQIIVFIECGVIFFGILNCSLSFLAPLNGANYIQLLPLLNFMKGWTNLFGMKLYKVLQSCKTINQSKN